MLGLRPGLKARPSLVDLIRSSRSASVSSIASASASDSGSVGVILEVLEEGKDLIASLVRALLRTANRDFVRTLWASWLAGLASSICDRFVVLGLRRLREVDVDVVTILQT